jgi:phage regulator Rha-like protein
VSRQKLHTNKPKNNPVPAAPQWIERRIYLIRGHKVMLDSDLAALYQVPTKSLNLAVRRNQDRFPEDFMFQVSQDEMESLRFQIETSNEGRGGRRYLPYAFTEQGVAMLSSVLRSKRAVHVNIAIMRAFVRLRELLATNRDLAAKIDALEKKYEQHDATIKQVFEAIRQLMAPNPHRRQIGFRGSPRDEEENRTE